MPQTFKKIESGVGGGKRNLNDKNHREVSF